MVRKSARPTDSACVRKCTRNEYVVTHQRSARCWSQCGVVRRVDHYLAAGMPRFIVVIFGRMTQTSSTTAAVDLE